MDHHSIRILLPADLYDRLKEICPEHGDLSRLVRDLLIKHLGKIDEADH